MSDEVTRRTTAEIREDIGRTRLGLDFMIDALEGRLSMGSLIDEAMGMLRGRGRGGGEAPLGALIREHPGPAALITAGVVWLAVENRKDARSETRSAAGKKAARTRKAGTKKAARKSAENRAAGSRSGGRKSGARKSGGTKSEG